jgi:hypothetical protein
MYSLLVLGFSVLVLSTLFCRGAVVRDEASNLDLTEEICEVLLFDQNTRVSLRRQQLDCFSVQQFQDHEVFIAPSESCKQVEQIIMSWTSPVFY